MKNLFFNLMFLLAGGFCLAQENVIVPDLSEIGNPGKWTVYNRKVAFDKAVYLDAGPDQGFARMNGLNFANGTIELDIRGKDVRGRSFVGVAFHGVSDDTYDCIYFRPFNFLDSERKDHSVQYISHPEHTWYSLREHHPEEYENPVTPVPDPGNWFHARIEINHPLVKVYVDSSVIPSLEIKQLSSQKSGWIGFWTGNGSDGYFRNLTITPDEQ